MVFNVSRETLLKLYKKLIKSCILLRYARLYLFDILISSNKASARARKGGYMDYRIYNFEEQKTVKCFESLIAMVSWFNTEIYDDISNCFMQEYDEATQTFKTIKC